MLGLKQMMENADLPNTEARPNELAKAYDPSAIEEKWAAYWVAERLFEAGPGTPDGKSFTMLLPPPNVTGRLHMGHMLNQTEMDILTRWHRMRGERALWLPGTDHAGIATQMMVERQLAAEGGPSRKKLGREAFLDRVWAWKRRYGGAITDQMRRLGASVDWSREYFTMDRDLSAAVNEAFVRLWEEGLIYRGAYIVNWDPAAQTAVSDLEVVHEERMGKLYHIRYLLEDGSGSIVIATTRPETMLGDTAIAVSPDDPRYTALIGKMACVPLSGGRDTPGGPGHDRAIPILADSWANPEFGTGAVKVTPAHDPNDFAIGQRHGLPSLSIFDVNARVTLPGSKYDGMDRFDAREAIVADLAARDLLVEVKDHPMSLGLSQRTGSVIEPRLSDQWFLAVNKTPSAGGDSIAAKAIAAVREGHIRFTPENYAKTYFEWMGNLHDWCLSRQLWWGHRIPAWYCEVCGEMTVAHSAPEACPKCASFQLRQETDVLDTWFSSGLLPFTTLGWPGEMEQGLGPEGPGTRKSNSGGSSGLDPEALGLRPSGLAFYPTDLLVTGFDILFFWVARMIMLGTHFMLDVPMPGGAARTLAEAVPFRDVYIHGLIRDANREKMSKTKGNVIDPLDIIQRFGTDAVRFTLASMASPGTDIAFSEERTDGYRAFANKIWNAARFLFMNLDRAREAGIATTLGAPHLASEMWDEATIPLESRWILTRLSTASAAVAASLDDYRFDEAASHIYRFFWGDLCDWYLELIKLRLDFSEQADKAATSLSLAVLTTVFEAALRQLSPFMPFLTEEIWHALYAALGQLVPAKSIALTRFPLAADFPADPAAEQALGTLQELIVTVRGLRKELGVPEKEATPIRMHATDPTVTRLAQENTAMLARMARVAAVEVSASALNGNGVRVTPQFEVQVVYERQIDVAVERERLTKDLAKYQKGLTAAERQLGNEAFIAKAPAHIVDGLKKQAAETRQLYDKTKAALDDLPAA